MANPVSISVGPHVLRYGTPKDQKHLLGEFLETYDQLVINATMVAHMPGAIASFVIQRAKKPYFIDPQTHAFQHDVSHLESTSERSKGEIKRSVKRLLKRYGEPVEKIVDEERRFVLPEDFSDEKLRKDFANRVVDYQLNTLSEHALSSEDSKYYQFLKDKGIVGNTEFRPSFVIAPYFCMESNTLDKWIDLNLSFAEDTKEIASEKNVPFAVQIVISQKLLLNPKQIDTLVERYTALETGAFLIWVDSFSEQESSEEALAALVELADRLRKKAPVVNLYSGFFSALLVHAGILAGATHSLEYGEKRPVVPVGGGIPVAKFYVPCLHTRLAFRTAVRAVRSLGGFESIEAFHNNVCDCKRCKEIVNNDPDQDFLAYGRTKVKGGRQYPIMETMDNSVRHYMWSKANEFAEGLNVQQVLGELRSAADSLRKDVGVENTEHCRIWADILSKVVK